MDSASLLVGYATSLTLIVAIGAQNAFVLRQGIRREHVFPIALVCSVSDAVLMTAGITGLGAMLTTRPDALAVARYAGAAFLICYGLFAARRALRPQALTASDRPAGPLRIALLTCLGFTYLNPHVYLDTVVLIGSLANQHGTPGRWWFATGAVTASFTWFFTLAYLARRLAPWFAHPRAWRLLDSAIAVIMFTLGLSLVLG